MLPPLSVTGCLIMNAREKFKLLQRHLLRRNSQLLLQLALCRALHAQDCRVEFCARLAGDTQRVRTASVGPHVREGDFLRGALLQEKTIVGVEEEDGKGTVEETSFDVGVQMAFFILLASFCKSQSLAKAG